MAIIFRSQLGVHPICTTNVKNLNFLRSFEKVGPVADLSASFRVAGDALLSSFFLAVQIIWLRSPNQDVVIKIPFVDTPQAYSSYSSYSSSLSVVPQVWELKEGGEIKEYEVSALAFWGHYTYSDNIVNPCVYYMYILYNIYILYIYHTWILWDMIRILYSS